VILQDFILLIFKRLLLFALLVSSLVHADQFYQSRTWLNVLYYQKTSQGYLSIADADTFFITPMGKTDPKAEYEASVQLAKTQDTDFRKKFPLRYKLITTHLNLPYQPLVTPNQSVNRMSIAYPNRYMSNPSSMFGHLFLMMNSDKGLMDSKIVHYIANTDGANSYLYIINGLSGKFKGWFLEEPYYYRIKDYNYVEDRDIFYYDLNIPIAKIRDLQLHVIELKQSHFNYAFLDENCAFFIGKFLNVGLDTDIIDAPFVAIPSRLITVLKSRGLLQNQFHRPASTTLFNRQFNHLSLDNQHQVIQLLTTTPNGIPKDPKVLKAFLTISEYHINNTPDYAQIIRQNRIDAYKHLQSVGDAQVRIPVNKQPVVETIHSRSLDVMYGSQNRLFVSYSPINYGISDTFGDPEIKTLQAISPRLIINRHQNPQFDLTLATIVNQPLYTRVLTNYSWRLDSRIGIKDADMLTNNSYDRGLTYAFGNGTLYGFLGASLSNYDTIADTPLNDFKLRTSATLGTSQTLIKDKINASLVYDRQFNQNYISARVTLKAWAGLQEIKVIHGNQFDEIRFQSTVVF